MEGKWIIRVCLHLCWRWQELLRLLLPELWWGRVERIFVDESRVAAPGPDVAEREYVFGRFVELIDLGGGNTVSEIGRAHV